MAINDSPFRPENNFKSHIKMQHVDVHLLLMRSVKIM